MINYSKLFRMARYENAKLKVENLYLNLDNYRKNDKIKLLIDTLCCDPLTGCFNRVGLKNKIIKNEARSYLVANCDLDNFKNINDTFGHEKGDQVLKDVANIFLSNIRSNIDEKNSSDFVVRYGGDEFYIFFDMDIDNVDTIIERLYVIQDSVYNYGKEIYSNSENDGNLSVSIGLSKYNSEISFENILNKYGELYYLNDINELNSLYEIFNDADKALSEAKKNGKNKILFGEGVNYIKHDSDNIRKRRKND